MPITVAIVEDNRGTRESLVKLLGRSPGLRCLHACATAEEALQRIPQDRPQVALIDINLPGMSGIECVGELKRRMPELQVLMLTTYEESNLIFDSLRAGANGYLLKNMPPDELVEAVELVQAGGAPMSIQIARKVVDFFHKLQAPSSVVEQLSKREHQILTLLARGLHYKEISNQLGISLSTVRTHIHAVYQKLHVQSRTEAVVKFLNKE